MERFEFYRRQFTTGNRSLPFCGSCGIPLENNEMVMCDLCFYDPNRGGFDTHLKRSQLEHEVKRLRAENRWLKANLGRRSLWTMEMKPRSPGLSTLCKPLGELTLDDLRLFGRQLELLHEHLGPQVKPK